MTRRLLILTLAIAAALEAADTALPQIGQGINAYGAHDYRGAITHLREAKGKAPRLADYIAYYLASAEQLTGDFDAAAKDLAAYASKPVPSSPLEGKIAVLHARVLLDLKTPQANAQALAVMRAADSSKLPQPDGDYALALAYDAVSNADERGSAASRRQAVIYYQKVFYGYPTTDFATQSGIALERLQAAMMADFPPASNVQKLARAAAFIDGKQYAKARTEYAALAESLTGADQEEARVGAGVAEFLNGQATTAYYSLRNLTLHESDTDAKRLFYMEEAARRMNSDADMLDAVAQLKAKYPESIWRLKALISAGNRFVVTNDQTHYTPLFRDAIEDFAPESTTAYAHWKLTWDAYLSQSPERGMMLRRQVERYPFDTRASSALYFLGRIAEKAGRAAEARACYEALSRHFPHYFYAVLARDRMKEVIAAPDATTQAWLEKVPWSEPRDYTSTSANAATKARIDRARLLMLAGLPDTAESELRYGARQPDEQAHLLALEFARAAPSPFAALRIMKSFSGDYLALPLENAPLRFWQTLFPMPWRDDIVDNAEKRDLDPWSVAGLIRQESEFNPAAHSRANAYGLMQLIPSTGRMLGNQEGLRITSNNMLLSPAISIRLGTRYVRSQLSAWNGDWVQTLAAYNAGPGRVREWLTWAKFSEPAEFIENIPFNETRDYVQAVLRNADMYRTLYSDKGLLAKAGEIPDASDVPAVRLASLPKSMTAKAPVKKPTVKATVAAKPKPAAVKTATAKAAVKTAPVNTATAKKAAAKKPVQTKSATPAKDATAKTKPAA